MGLIGKFFEKLQVTKKPAKGNAPIEKTAEMLDEALFWHLVDLSRYNTPTP